MILVTGATGLVGQHLIAELVDNNQPIRALFRSEEKRKLVLHRLQKTLDSVGKERLKTIDWVKADITDLATLNTVFTAIEVVYHCAGLVSFDVGDKKKLRKTNIEGTANVVNLSIQHHVKRLCHVSSVATLGNEPTGKPINEESPRNNNAPHNYYDISKYGAEMEVWRGAQEGLSVIIVNPGVIIGAGNWATGSSQLFSRVANEFPFKIPRKSGFVGVKDVARAMLALTNSKLSSERFVLVSEVLSIEQLTHSIAEKLHCTPPRYALKKWMVYSLWLFQSVRYLFTGRGKTITLQLIHDLYASVDFDSQKIKRAIGFTFTPIQQAIKETADQYKGEHSN